MAPGMNARPLSFTDSGGSSPILFFVHGWPDTGALWAKQIEHFSAHWRCVAVTLPAFTAEDLSSGEDFPELVERLVATVEQVRSGKNTEVVLVGHDWGAFLVYLLDQRHPEVASRIITLDVGAHFQPRSVGHAVFMLGYQWYLVLAYWMGKLVPAVGNFMTRLFSTLARAPRGSEVEARSNYPYWYFWRARLCRRYRGALPARYQPKKPLLYLHGLKKRYAFHSPKWEQLVSATPGSKVVGLPGCDHWFMVRDPVATNRTMETWLGR